MALPHACHTIGGAAIAADEAALERAVRQIVALDLRVYESASHGHIGGVEQWLPIFRKHPQTWRALADTNGDIIAYWQIASLKAETFELARRGRLHPADLADRDYEALTQPGRHSLYFASVCIAPEWRTTEIYVRLIESFFEVIDELAACDARFEDMAAVAHSEEGRRLCETLGLKRQGCAADLGECYSGRFLSIVERFAPLLARRRPALLARYLPHWKA